MLSQEQIQEIIKRFDQKDWVRVDLSAHELSTFSEDNLHALVEAVAQCPEVEEIDLSENNLGDFSEQQFAILCSLFAKCPKLQKIDFTENHLFKLSDKHWEILGDALAERLSLQKIDLSDNRLALQSAKQRKVMGDNLARSHTLQELDLRCNGLELLANAQLQDLLNNALACTSLTSIDLGEILKANTRNKPLIVNRLTTIFESLPPHIKAIELGYIITAGINFEQFGFEPSKDTPGYTLTRIRPLQDLECSKTMVIDPKQQQLQAQLNNIKEVKPNNFNLSLELPIATMDSLCATLGQVASLRTLTLFSFGDFPITPPRLQKLTDLIEKCTALTDINLDVYLNNNNNKLQNFVKLLVACKDLQSLTLGRAGLHALCDRLQDLENILIACTNLKRLAFNINNIEELSDEQISNFCLALGKRPCLNEITFKEYSTNNVELFSFALAKLLKMLPSHITTISGIYDEIYYGLLKNDKDLHSVFNYVGYKLIKKVPTPQPASAALLTESNPLLLSTTAAAAAVPSKKEIVVGVPMTAIVTGKTVQSEKELAKVMEDAPEDKQVQELLNKVKEQQPTVFVFDFNLSSRQQNAECGFAIQHAKITELSFPKYNPGDFVANLNTINNFVERCTALESIDLTALHTSDFLQEVGGILARCKNLKSIKLPLNLRADLYKLTDAQIATICSILNKCKSLQTIDVGYVDSADKVALNAMSKLLMLLPTHITKIKTVAGGQSWLSTKTLAATFHYDTTNGLIVRGVKPAQPASTLLATSSSQPASSNSVPVATSSSSTQHHSDVESQIPIAIAVAVSDENGNGGSKKQSKRSWFSL